MKLLPAAAVSAAAALSALALSDAVLHALAPAGTAPWDPASGSEMVLRAVQVLHGVAYLLLAAVLTVYRRKIDDGSRALAWLRTTLAVCYVSLGLPFCWAALFALHMEKDAPGWLLTVMFVAFLGAFVVAIPFGLLLLKHRRMRLSGWLLASPVVIFPLTIVLDSISKWGHPAYLETVVNLGTALIGVAATAERGAGRGDLARFDTAVQQGNVA